MNKNGFTLVELIAVIVILGLLALVANSSVVNVVKNSKSDLYNAQLKLIESAAESWGNDNLDKLPENGKCSYITLGDLKGYGLFEEKIVNPKTNKEFSDDLYIKITSKINSSGMLNTKYEADTDNISTCEKVYKSICTAVTEETVTTGNIPNGNYNLGDEYICSVNDTTNYHFFILSTEGNIINLIMDSNININGESVKIGDPIVQNQVAWYEISKVADKGPVTALNYLQTATSSWINLDEIIIDSFETDTTPIVLLEKYNMYARLPKLNEIIETGCKEFIDNSCPLWITGSYWTDSYTTWNGYPEAWSVFESGRFDYLDVSLLGGIRPVITLHDYQIR